MVDYDNPPPDWTSIVTRVVYVDKNRTDNYAQNGSISRPYKTIQAAVDYIASVAVAGQDWTVEIATGQYLENVVLEDNNLHSLAFSGIGVVGIVPLAGNSLQSTANNDNLVKFRMYNIEFTRPVVFTGSNGASSFADVFHEGCKFVLNATITLNCINNWSMGGSCYVETNISLTNVPFFYIDSARMNGTLTMVCDSTLPAPSGGYDGTTFVNGVYELGNVTLTKGGTANGIFVSIGSRINGSAGTLTNPVGWTLQLYDTFVRGNLTNNGTLQQRNSYIEKVLTNTGTWTLDNFSSQIKNQSTVPGTTVTDALNNIGGSTILITPEGGFAVYMINKTGSPSVKGTIVYASAGTDNGFTLLPADGINGIGAVYDAGIADGSLCRVAIGGRVQVKLENNVASTRSNWVRGSITVAGRADATAGSPPNQTDHFKEIGHCIETVAGDPAGALAYIIMHFN